MTQNQEEKEVKSCCQGEENACGEGCACGAEGEPAAEGQAEAATPDTVETLQTALKLAEAKESSSLLAGAAAPAAGAAATASEEVQKAHKFGIEKFAENLLPVVDSLEKALEVTKDDQDNPMREGMLATYRQLVHALDVSGMKPIDPKGEAFDPHKHQAIAMVPAPEGVAAGNVVEVFQRGWLISERVLRPAMVSVAQG